MMDYLSIFLSYKQGRRNGTPVGLKFLVGFFIFLLLFRPIVWVLKVTGIFSLLQWIGLINEKGYFDFVSLFILLVCLFILAGVLSVVGTVLFGISSFLIGRSNK